MLFFLLLLGFISTVFSATVPADESLHNFIQTIKSGGSLIPFLEDLGGILNKIHTDFVILTRWITFYDTKRNTFQDDPHVNEYENRALIASVQFLDDSVKAMNEAKDWIEKRINYVSGQLKQELNEIKDRNLIKQMETFIEIQNDLKENNSSRQGQVFALIQEKMDEFYAVIDRVNRLHNMLPLDDEHVSNYMEVMI